MKKDIKPEEVHLQKYEKEYSEDGLWKKIGTVAKKAGLKVIYSALLLYYALQSPQVSLGDKAKIIGALGYFIMPADLLPDAIAILGFTDDAAVLIFVVKKIGSAIDNRVKQQAREKLQEWFGDYDSNEIKDVP